MAMMGEAAYDLVARRARNLSKASKPLVDRLPLGHQVLLLGPAGQLTGDRDPAWFILFHRRTDEWLAALALHVHPEAGAPRPPGQRLRQRGQQQVVHLRPVGGGGLLQQRLRLLRRQPGAQRSQLAFVYI